MSNPKRPEPEWLMELRHGEASSDQQQKAYREMGKLIEHLEAELAEVKKRWDELRRQQ